MPSYILLMCTYAAHAVYNRLCQMLIQALYSLLILDPIRETLHDDWGLQFTTGHCLANLSAALIQFLGKKQETTGKLWFISRNEHATWQYCRRATVREKLKTKDKKKERNAEFLTGWQAKHTRHSQPQSFSMSANCSHDNVEQSTIEQLQATGRLLRTGHIRREFINKQKKFLSHYNHYSTIAGVRLCFRSFYLWPVRPCSQVPLKLM